MNASEISRAISALDQAHAHIAANRTYTSHQEADLIMELKLSSHVLKQQMEKLPVSVSQD